MNRLLRALSLSLLVASAIACGSSEASAPASSGPSPQARAQASEIFTTRCVPCHGTTGAGNGPASAGLTPPPRNMSDPAWQASVTDEHLANIIKGGGVAVGKSPAMPGNPDLVDKPDVVAALVAYIRRFRP